MNLRLCMSVPVTTVEFCFQNLKAVFQLTNVHTVDGHMAKNMQSTFIRNAILRNMKLTSVMREKLFSAHIVTNGSSPNA
jgi:hypothetical protein